MNKFTPQSLKWLKDCRETCLSIDIKRVTWDKHYPSSIYESYKYIKQLYHLLINPEIELQPQWVWSSDPYLSAFNRWALHHREFIELYNNDNANENHPKTNWNIPLRRLTAIYDSEIFISDKQSMHRLRRHHTQKIIDNIIHFKCKYSKIVIIRVDLAFSKNTLIGKPWGSGDTSDITKPLAKLIEWMRADQRDSYLHHSIKLELGVEKGLHAHALFILNGSKVREDETIGALIVEKWKDITNGQGIGFNCNNKDYKYRLAKCGIGLFGHADKNFIKNIERMVSYLAKPDYLLRISYPDIGRIVRTSIIPSGERLQQEMRPIYQQRKQVLEGS